jgi:hypothetical protein
VTLRPVLTDFSAGELSPKLSGRVDLPIYAKGAKEITNFRIGALGGVSKRPGTTLYHATTSNHAARIIPWVISDSITFLVELTATATPGEGRLEIHGATSGQLPLTTAYLAADLMEIQYEQTYRELYLVHPDHPPVFLRYSSGGVGAAVFEYDSDLQTMSANLIEWTAPTVTPYETYDFWEKIATWLVPRKAYVATTTFAARTCASVERRDNIVIVTFSSDPTHASIDTHTNTTLTGFSGLVVNSLQGFYVSGTGIPDGAYIVSNTATEATLSAAATGTATITLTRGNLRIAKGTTYIHQGTIDADLRPFLGSGNYPSVVFFHAGRLWLGGSANDPSTLWGSKPNDLMNFNLFEEVVYDVQTKTDPGIVLIGADSGAPGTTTVNGTTITGFSGLSVDALIGKYVTGLNIAYGTKVTDNDATTVTVNIGALAAGTSYIQFTDWKDAGVAEYDTAEGQTQQVGPGSAVRIKLATEEDETIRWISGKDALVVGTASSEWVIENAHNAVQVRAAMASRYGSAAMQARMVGGALLYVSASSRHVRQMAADLTPPLTAQASHMIESGITQIDFQQAPDVALYAVLANGEMVRCVFDQSMGVMAWDRIRLRTRDAETGAVLSPVDKITSVAVVPGTDRDYVYIVTLRTINTTPTYNIELFQENVDSVVTTRRYLDLSVQKGPSAAFTAVTGLGHLDGNMCTYRALSAAGTWIEGYVQPSGGSATVPSSTYAIVGLAYDAKLRTMRIDSRETEGMMKQIGDVFFRLLASCGFSLYWGDGNDANGTALAVGSRDSRDVAVIVPVLSGTAPLYTGPLQVTTDAPSEHDAELTIESTSPVPVGIQTIVPVVEVGG